MKDGRELLDHRQFTELNQKFYDAEPYRYFRHRLYSLLLFAGRPEDLARLLEDGVKFGKFEVVPGGTSEDDDEQLRRFIVTEAEVLMHHATEALIRLFVGHRGLPPCPWLEISSLYSVRRFKETLRDLRSTDFDHLRDDLCAIFVGPATLDSLVEWNPKINWEEHLQVIHLMVVRFADRLLSHDRLYNSMKHGLTVVSEETAFSIDFGEGLKVGAEGDALSHLELRDDEEESKRWYRGTTWVAPEQLVSAVWAATELMEALWSVARARYVAGKRTHAGLFTMELYEALGLEPPPGISANQIFVQLAYFAEDLGGNDPQ